MSRFFVAVALACTASGCASGPVAPTRTAASAEAGATAPTAAALAVATDGARPATASADGPWIGAAGESDYVLTGQGEHRIGVWIDVPNVTDRPHVATAVTLTIDTSGSMQGEKIRRAREAAKAVVDSLADGDFVAVHSFDDNARELVPPVVLSPENRRHVLETVSELSANGSTNIEDALTLAADRMKSAPSSHPVRRIVLISDGKATVGASSATVLGSIAERATQSGTQITSLGVGMDYDELTLNELAVRSSGRLYHLADAAELPSIVKREMGLLQATMATNAFVEIVPAPGVRVIGVDNVRTQWSSGSLRVPLGVLFAGQKRELLVRVQATEPIEGKHALASVRLHYGDPMDGSVARVQEVVVRGEGTGDPSLFAEHQNPRVREISSFFQVAAWTSSAAQELGSGHFEEADKKLAQAESELRSGASKAKDAVERQRFDDAAGRIATARKNARAAAAKPAPAARAAGARAGSLDLNDAAMDAYGY